MAAVLVRHYYRRHRALMDSFRRQATITMTSANFDPTFGWHDIADHTLTLRGIGPQGATVVPSITFVARSVLSGVGSIHDPTAIALATTVTIPNDYSDVPIRHCQSHGFYGSLIEQRTALAALRNGTASEARFLCEGLELHLYPLNHGTGSTFCVEGVTSTIFESEFWPWPKHAREVGSRGERNFSDYCLRFAFVTSQIDPPYLDSFIHDIDLLLTHLQEFANG